MKNEKDQKKDEFLKKTNPRTTKKAVNESGLKRPTEGGRGTNANDDPAEDSKGGGNYGAGNQEGANQGKFKGAGNKR